MDDLLLAFIEEADELLEAMEADLLRLEEGDRNPETINAIFRAAHTIKGDAGIVELPDLRDFAHAMEDVLSRLRGGELAVDADLTALLLDACDQIKALLADAAAGSRQPPAPLLAAGAALAMRLRAFAGNTATSVPSASTFASPATTAVTHTGEAPEGIWHIRVDFGADCLRHRTDPLDILRFLGTRGRIVSLQTRLDRLPEAPTLDAETCYLSVELELFSSASREAIEQAFDFVRDDCTLHIEAPESHLAAVRQSIADLPDEVLRLGEMLVQTDALTSAELDEGLTIQAALAHAAADHTAPPLGEVLVARQVLPQDLIDATTAKQAQTQVHRTQEARQVRVPAEKLDQLIDLVGELVISSAAAQLKARNTGNADLAETNAELVRLVEDMRELSTQLRMVKVGEAFGRFRRVARDMARDLQRDIDLVIRGEDAELDKSVVEKIGDPLMHLFRNAFDHGIESPEVRLAAGKPARGTITLNAYHDTGGIVIEVGDDGAGLDKERILAKAIERGLVTPEQSLTDDEILDLIFQPGFSTAATVTNISGRGVGMDVVRSNIKALRGTVGVITAAGQGTTFQLRLPLTMAIIDGFLIGLGDSRYVIPLETVVECLALPAEAAEDRDYINLRGHVLPLLRLREVFDTPGTHPVRENVVVVSAGGQSAGIVVDALLGEQQSVIKPLGSLFRALRGVAGTTILGTGAVALILDIPALLALVSERSGTAAN